MLLSIRSHPTRIEAVESCSRSFTTSQFTIRRDVASEVTLPVTKESAMKAVPTVRSMPTISPNRKFTTAPSSMDAY